MNRFLTDEELSSLRKDAEVALHYNRNMSPSPLGPETIVTLLDNLTVSRNRLKELESQNYDLQAAKDALLIQLLAEQDKLRTLTADLEAAKIDFQRQIGTEQDKVRTLTLQLDEIKFRTR